MTPDPQQRRHEAAAVIGAFLLFFLLFCSLFMLRPVRDTFGVASGVSNLQWLFLGTFVTTLVVVPLYGWLSSKVARRLLMPACYIFSAFMFALFAMGLLANPENIWIARGAFVWLAMTNLFVFSLAWSLMSDVFNPDQGHRLYGRIAAGASVGGVAGPLLSVTLVGIIGHAGLLLLSAALLLGTLPCVRYLMAWRARWGNPADQKPTSEAIGGGIWSGLTLIFSSPQLLRFAGYIVLLSTVYTFLYFEQARLVAEFVPDNVQRTQLFSAIDLTVQSATLVLQLFVTGQLAKRLGVTSLLVSVPAVMVAAFLLLAAIPGLTVLIGVMVLRRVGDYALTSPGREMVFTTFDAETKYRAKNAIDTVVFRGSDLGSGFLSQGIVAVAGSGGAAVAGAAVAALWGWVGWVIGKRHDKMTSDKAKSEPAPA